MVDAEWYAMSKAIAIIEDLSAVSKVEVLAGVLEKLEVLRRRLICVEEETVRFRQSLYNCLELFENVERSLCRKMENLSLEMGECRKGTSASGLISNVDSGIIIPDWLKEIAMES
jgi:hypothetical protein